MIIILSTLFGHNISSLTTFPDTKKRVFFMKFEQGLCGSWKTWKVLEFYCGVLQDWKVLEGKSWKKASGPGEFWKSVKLKSKNMKCMADRKKN